MVGHSACVARGHVVNVGFDVPVQGLLVRCAQITSHCSVAKRGQLPRQLGRGVVPSSKPSVAGVGDGQRRQTTDVVRRRLVSSVLLSVAGSCDMVVLHHRWAEGFL